MLMKLLPIFLLICAGLCIEDPPITHEVYFDIEQGGEKLGRITLGLFGSVVPKSVKNFVEITKGFEGISYDHTIFHRVIKGFMIQGGDFEYGSGIGGYSIYGNKFEDENFRISFSKPGYLAYANGGPDSNGSQFFITTAVTDWLNGKHVIMGKVLDGFETLSRVENVKTGEMDKPVVDVVIAKAGVRDMEVTEQQQYEWWSDNKPIEGSHKGWIIFILMLFVSITAYGIRLRQKQYREVQEEIEFHRV